MPPTGLALRLARERYMIPVSYTNRPTESTKKKKKYICNRTTKTKMAKFSNHILKIKIMKNLILSIFAFFALSCSDDTPTNSTTLTPITYVLIGKTSISNPNPPLQNVVVSNQTQWNSLLIAMNSVNNVSNSFTEQNIDFDNFDIVAVFSNTILNSSSTVDITNIEENQTNRFVTVQNLTDGISGDVAQPFHIVKIPKSTKPILFQ